MSNDQRKFERLSFVKEVHIESATGPQHVGELINISLHGALVSMALDTPLNPEQTYQLKLQLGDQQSIEIQECRAVHQDAPVVGFVFDTIDIESITHLRRLLEVNLGSDFDLQRELSSLVQEVTEE